jgi:uncharacterized protein (TIGR00255 family)
MPNVYKEKDIAIRNIITKKLERGKIDLVINVENSSGILNNRINPEILKNYFFELKNLKEKLEINITDDSIFQAVMRLPELTQSDAEQISDTEWIALFEGVEQACENLIEFRKQEGAALSEDIIQRIELIKSKIKDIEVFELQRIETIKNRISRNLNEFFDTDKLDNNRFEQELIFYLERLDITEEKIRLSNHCDYFLEISKNDLVVGKKLSFVVQEMGREINTLGSKANHSEMQKIVVEMKDELEKIKEQIMNIL